MYGGLDRKTLEFSCRTGIRNIVSDGMKERFAGLSNRRQGYGVQETASRLKGIASAEDASRLHFHNGNRRTSNSRK